MARRANFRCSMQRSNDCANFISAEVPDKGTITVKVIFEPIMEPFIELGISWASMPLSRLDAALRLITKDGCVAFRNGVRQMGIRHYVLLQTCNRFEAYFYIDGDYEADNCQSITKQLKILFAEITHLNEEFVEERVDFEALIYLTRLAAGLESKFFGEYQILGQIKDAHRAALENGNCASRLDYFFRNIIAVAKKVRTSLDLGAVAPSVCAAGVDLLEEKCGGFSGKDVFIVGSGKTGSLAARIVHKRGARSIAICNRNAERAARIIRELNATAVDYANRYEKILESDIIISATSSPHVVIEDSFLGRLDKPTAFLDLAMPRDIDEAIAYRNNATVLDLSSIDALAKHTIKERERLTASAMKIINENLNDIAYSPASRIIHPA